MNDILYITNYLNLNTKLTNFEAYDQLGYNNKLLCDDYWFYNKRNLFLPFYSMLLYSIVGEPIS